MDEARSRVVKECRASGVGFRVDRRFTFDEVVQQQALLHFPAFCRHGAEDSRCAASMACEHNSPNGTDASIHGPTCGRTPPMAFGGPNMGWTKIPPTSRGNHIWAGSS